MKVFKQLICFALLTLSIMACGQPTNRPVPGPSENSFSGTVFVPGDQDVNGTAVVACFVVDVGCDEAKTVVAELTGSGLSATFNLKNLENLPYDIYAVKDVNGDGDYFGDGDLYGELNGSMVPPKTGLELHLMLIGDQNTPDLGQPEPYVVKGRVTDSQGSPLSGVEVFADNTAYYNMNVFGISDSNGYYRIELGDITPSSWQVGAYIERDYDGQRLKFSLDVENDVVFAGVTGAIRNLTWRLSGETPEGGYYGAFAYVYAYEVTIDDLDYDAIELSFIPEGPLVDGSIAEPFTRRVEGGSIWDIPVGHYTVSARYAPEGKPAVPLLIRMRDTATYATSSYLSFQDSPLYGILAEIELASN
ncbi:MAG: carboxypeptidase regulatory-like domain-containing protein [Trueperaceae bacterium]|nr:carboxypeptidase regulatory-like domain-containing protein [Trueperaceae bacterium]